MFGPELETSAQEIPQTRVSNNHYIVRRATLTRSQRHDETQLWWKRSYLVSSTVISAITIAGVELTIQYNDIPQVNSIRPAAQLYPMITSAVVLTLILILHRRQHNKGTNQRSSPTTSPSAPSGSVFRPRPPPEPSHRGSAVDADISTASATTSSSTNGDTAPGYAPPSSGFPAGWNSHQDHEGRVFWLPEGQVSNGPPSEPEYPAVARTVS